MLLDVVPNLYDAVKDMFISSQELGNRVLDLLAIGLKMVRNGILLLRMRVNINLKVLISDTTDLPNFE